MDWRWRVNALVTGYDDEKFWRMMFVCRKQAANPFYRLYQYICWARIRRIESKFCASLGTRVGGSESCSVFHGKPHLPHGINGVLVGNGATVGQRVTILPFVTLADCVSVGDDCFIGVGATVCRGARVGNRVNIGANCVVIEDVPDNATVVMQKPRVILRDASHHREKPHVDSWAQQ